MGRRGNLFKAASWSSWVTAFPLGRLTVGAGLHTPNSHCRFREHRIRDEQDNYRYRDYIHLNPVKDEYVACPGDWTWSGFRRHVRMGRLDPNWPGSSPVDLPDVDD